MITTTPIPVSHVIVVEIADTPIRRVVFYAMSEEDARSLCHTFLMWGISAYSQVPPSGIRQYKVCSAVWAPLLSNSTLKGP